MTLLSPPELLEFLLHSPWELMRSSQDLKQVYLLIYLPPKVIFILSSGVSEMSLGQRVSLTLSADMAYGDQGTSDGVIPGGATLIFDLEIIDIK